MQILSEEANEKMITVVRNGKKVRKELKKKPTVKKRRTAAQKAGAKKAARARKAKAGAISRKRKISMRKRQQGKFDKNTNKRFRVAASNNEGDVVTVTEKVKKFFEKKDDMVTLELYNGYEIEGPKSNLTKAKKLVKECDKQMKQEEKDYEDEGESAAMDARDNVFYEFEDKFEKIGFKEK